MTGDILDIELGTFEHGTDLDRKRVVEAVMHSLITGFVYVAHDIDERVIDDAYDRLTAFFALPTEAKERWRVPGSHGQTGYTGLLVETAASSDVPDWKEMLNWSRDLPPGHPLRARYPHRYLDQVLPDEVVPGIGDVLLDLHDRLLRLQQRVLRIVAVGLGCHVGFFDSMLEHGPALTRAIRYPPMTDAPVGGHVWADEHTDINLITALPRATAKGLQVRTEAGWVDAVPPAGHAIINTGIMLDRLSNGVVPAGRHRVVADPDDPTAERLSVVQFLHPTPWTVLSPVATTVTPERPQRHAGIEAGALLDQVLYEINLVEGNRRVAADDEQPAG